MRASSACRALWGESMSPLAKTGIDTACLIAAMVSYSASPVYMSALDPRLDGLSVNAGFTYTKATSEGDIANFKGRDLPLYSRQVLNLGARYVVNRWSYNLDMFAQSQQHAPGTGGVYITDPTPDGQYGDIPGYATWSTRVGYDFGPEASNLKVGAGIKNLFNQEY